MALTAVCLTAEISLLVVVVGEGGEVKGQHPLSIKGAASAVKGQHLCVWWWGLHQQLKNWEEEGTKSNTIPECIVSLSKGKVALSVKNGHVPSFPVSE